jgi:hypothetical protein
MWTLILKENRVLKRIFESKREELRAAWELSRYKSSEFLLTPNIIRLMKSSRMRCDVKYDIVACLLGNATIIHLGFRI